MTAGQFVPPPTYAQGQSWRRWINKSGVDCPAFGCVQLGKHADDPDTALALPSRALWVNHEFRKDDTRLLLHGYQPDRYALAESEHAMFAFNADAMVPKGGRGWLTQDYPAMCLHSDLGYEQNGRYVGPVIGQWYLRGMDNGAATWVMQSHGNGRISQKVGTQTIHEAWISPARGAEMLAAMFVGGNEHTAATPLDNGENVLVDSSEGQWGISEAAGQSPRFTNFVHRQAWNGIDGCISCALPGIYQGFVSARIWVEGVTTGEKKAWLTLRSFDGPTKSPSAPETEQGEHLYAKRVFKDDTAESHLPEEMVGAPFFFGFRYPNQAFTLRINYSPTGASPGARIADLSIFVQRVAPSQPPITGEPPEASRATFT